MIETIKKMTDLELKMQVLREDLKDTIAKRLNDVKSSTNIEVLNDKPKIITISSSELSKDFQLSPDYYDLETQIYCIKSRINECKDLDDILRSLDKMLKDRKIKDIRFNDTIIKALTHLRDDIKEAM